VPEGSELTDLLGAYNLQNMY